MEYVAYSILVLILFVVVNTVRKNNDPAQNQAVSDLIEVGNRFFDGQITEGQLAGEVSGILIFVKSNNRAHLASLLKIRAPAVFTPTQTAILYGLVVDTGRQLNINKM